MILHAPPGSAAVARVEVNARRFPRARGRIGGRSGVSSASGRSPGVASRDVV